MIPITYTEAFELLFLAWLIYLLILWGRESARQNRNEWNLIHSQLFHCDQCHHSFVPDEPMNVTRCPRCNTMCFRRKR